MPEVPSPLQRAQQGIVGNTKKVNPQSGEPLNMQDDKTLSRQNSKTVLPIELKKQTVYLPKPLAKQVKKHAAEVEKSISDITVEALEQYLARQ